MSKLKARASRPCESCNQHTGKTLLPSAHEHQWCAQTGYSALAHQCFRSTCLRQRSSSMPELERGRPGEAIRTLQQAFVRGVGHANEPCPALDGHWFGSPQGVNRIQSGKADRVWPLAGPAHQTVVGRADTDTIVNGGSRGL